MDGERNEFSILLKKLMLKSGIKNATLAQKLQYDVSYISKWLSGKMLPARNNIITIVRNISESIVLSANTSCKEELQKEYSAVSDEELIQAVHCALLEAYENTKESSEIKKDDHTIMKAGMQLSGVVMMIEQLVQEDKEEKFDIAASMDLLSMEHESRLLLAGIRNGHFIIKEDYPNVHYSLNINLEVGERDYVYDSIFVIHMLTSFSRIDFNLYGNINAYGKVIFANDGHYAVSGMLMDKRQCISLIASTDEEVSSALYQDVKSLCCQENLLFKKTTMTAMLEKHDYIQSLLSTKIRWLIGHLTEQFLPVKLLDEFLPAVESDINSSEIMKVHSLTQNVMEATHICIMIYESAFADFVVSGELDFFNHKVRMNAKQRLAYMQNMLEMLEKGNINVKLISGGFSKDFQYITNPCLFLADTISYLRLENGCYKNNILVLNNKQIKNMFEIFYDEIWNNRNEIVLSEKNLIIEKIRYYMEQIQLLAKVE